VTDQLDAGIAQLLLAPILIDTANLDPQQKRATAKDIAAVDVLSRAAWPHISDKTARDGVCALAVKPMYRYNQT